MLDITQLFIAQAWADTAAPVVGTSLAQGSTTTQTIMNFMPMVLILLVFYMLIIRPQQKKVDEQEKMIKALRRGDRVITSGGIHGKIAKLEGDDHIILEIADGVQVKMVRSHVQSLAAKTDPAAPAANDSDDGDKKN